MLLILAVPLFCWLVHAARGCRLRGVTSAVRGSRQLSVAVGSWQLALLIGWRQQTSSVRVTGLLAPLPSAPAVCMPCGHKNMCSDCAKLCIDNRCCLPLCVLLLPALDLRGQGGLLVSLLNAC